VPWQAATYDGAALAEVLELFHQQHEQRFSYANRDDLVEMVTLRLAAIGRLSRPSDKAVEPPVHAGSPASRRVFVGNQWHDVPVWRRDAIGHAETIVGPAIVEEDYTTLYLAPHWRLQRIAMGHLAANFEGAPV
jgi:N-methylhydantoinase A